MSRHDAARTRRAWHSFCALFSLALCAAFFAASPCVNAALAQRRVPRFEDYPVRQVYRGRNAAVLLDADSWAFRTRLRAAARERPNFAGHYIVTGWGCGTGCTVGAVIDARTGRVYWFPHQASLDYDAPDDFESVRFRLDSRLIVIYGAAGEDGEADLGTHFYEFDGRRFRQVGFVPKRRRE
jgi:hypothetical protein